MNIYALPGHRVKVTERTSQAGDSYDAKKVSEHLEIGKIYTVLRTEVHNWSTDVYLQEFEDFRYPSGRPIHFNSVNFEDVDTQSPELNATHPDAIRYFR